MITETKIDPRIKRTRKLLSQALIDLLRDRPFLSITVQDIAGRAEVNRATFYDRFEDKFALLNYTVREMFQQQLDQKLPESPTFTPDNLRLLMLTVFGYLGEFLGRCSPASHGDEKATMMRQVQVHTYEVLLEWILRSPLPHGQRTVSPEVIAMVTSSAIFGSALQWTLNGREQKPEQLVDQVMAMLTSGLSTYWVST